MLDEMIVTTTQSGEKRYIICTKNSPDVSRAFIELSAREMKEIKWTMNCSKVVYAQNDWGKGKKGSITIPTSWNAQMLLDRIDNPLSGDNWKAGDVNAALAEIGVRSQHGAVTSISGVTGTTLWAE